MKRIVELKERDYTEKDQFDDAPVNYEDAIENYKRILEITGDVAANVLEPNSESVDQEGPHLENGRMIYASKTKENIDVTRQAGLWGVSMPRRFGGLNLPITVFSMLSELVAASRTSGLCSRVSTRSTSLAPKSSSKNTFHASPPARPCQWISPSPTPVQTCNA